VDTNVVRQLRLQQTIWRLLLFIGVTGFVFSAMLVIASSVPSVPPIPQYTLIVGVGVPIVWVGALAWLLPRRRRTGLLFGSPWQPAFFSLPRVLRIAVVACIVLLAIAFLSALPEVLAGNPEMHGGSYLLNNHGDVTNVNRSVYEGSVKAHDRFGASVLAWFYLIAAAVFVVAQRKGSSRLALHA
jgi:hypothetical protein